MIGFDDIEYASSTDVGIRRSHNQDAHALMPASDLEQFRQRGHVFLVADGMGAHAVGELASKMAVDNIPHLYSKYAQDGTESALRRSFVEANITIHNRGQQNREFQGMGTTGTAMVIRAEGAWVGHVGDSRVYRIRAGIIEQLSFDHSLVWELARRQRKNPEDLQGIPSNVIVRSLGPEPLVQVDVEGPHPVLPGDAYLICSDGLSGQVSDGEIGAVINALPAEEACELLVHLANLNGGPDNTTVVVVKVQGQSPPNSETSRDVVFPSSVSIPKITLGTRLYYSLGKIPWPLILMFLGIMLAGGAIALTYFQRSGAFFAFVVAGLALFSGLVAFVLQTMRENRQEEREIRTRPLQIYRQFPCTPDLTLCKRYAEASAELEKSVQQSGWPYDIAKYRSLMATAGQELERQSYAAAFTAQCRAMNLLASAVAANRPKGDGFRPNWDRPA